MAVIPFAEWRPDMPDMSQWAREALNVYAAEESYRPVPAFTGVSNALTARCQGAAWFRGPAGGVKMFAGDATKLYLLSSTTWSDVSRLAGGAYAPGADGQWRFTQYGYNAFAVNGVDNPQKFDLSAGANWVVMAGSPPVAKYIATVKDFVMMGNISTLPQRVQWSPINSPEGTWGSVAATQADFQDLADGGNINGIVGGEVGIVLQEAAIRRLTYEGSPLVFRIDKIGNEIGCSVPGSVASLLDLCFFVHKSGFYMLQGGQTFTPIGRGKVDRLFWAEFDETNLFRCSAAIDPIRSLYIFNYPATGNAGLPNKQLVFNWATNKWSRWTVSNEFLFSGVSQTSYTVETVDAAFSANLDTLPYSLDSSVYSGTASLLLYGFDTSHKSGSFSGTNLAATIQTAEVNPGGGKRTAIRSCRPLVDGGTPSISVGSRETQQGTVVFGNAVGLTGAGMAPLYQSGRYHRFQLTQPAGATWSNAMGIDDVDVRPMGQF